MKTGRNAPCPCGSGKKYKKCCLNKANAVQTFAARNQAKDGSEQIVFRTV